MMLFTKGYNATTTNSSRDQFMLSYEEINSNSGFSFEKKLLESRVFWGAELPAGREGYMVANELRPGRQHSKKEAVEFS